MTVSTRLGNQSAARQVRKNTALRDKNSKAASYACRCLPLSAHLRDLASPRR